MIWYLSIFNLAGFVAMGLDKIKAQRHLFRTSENTLFLIALGGGAPGVYLGMWCWRHKTRHKKFLVGIPLCIVVNIFCLYFFRRLYI